MMCVFVIDRNGCFEREGGGIEAIVETRECAENIGHDTWCNDIEINAKRVQI